MSATIDKDAFLQSYTFLIARTWSDDDFKEQLLSNPKPALAEAGIGFRPDAQIVVKEWPVSAEAAEQAEAGSDGNIDQQYNLWVSGDKTGSYELRLPLRPTDMSLSDASLANIAGGVGGSTSSCCCCCPCCCCGSGGGGAQA